MNQIIDALLEKFADIKRPNELYLLCDSLKSLIAQGQITETTGNCSIADFIREAPFPSDYIEIEFASTQSHDRYQLICETYHGVGGSFSSFYEPFLKPGMPLDINKNAKRNKCR